MSDSKSSGHVDDYVFSTKSGIDQWLDVVIEQDGTEAPQPEGSMEDFYYEFNTSSEADPNATDSDPNRTESGPNSPQDGGDSPAEAKASSDAHSGTTLSATHEPDSLGGAVCLQRIRQYFMMPSTYTFAQVRRFFEANDSVVRHLATYTVPHPDQYVTDAHGALHEPVLEGARADAAIDILHDITSIAWGSDAIEAQIDLVKDRDRDRDIWFPELMRKHRYLKRTRRAVAWLRLNDAGWKARDDAARAQLRRHRTGRRGSALSNEVRFDGGENKRQRGDDAEVSGESKRVRG